MRWETYRTDIWCSTDTYMNALCIWQLRYLHMFVKQIAFEFTRPEIEGGPRRRFAMPFEFYSSQNVKTPKRPCKMHSRTTFSISGRVNSNTLCFTTHMLMQKVTVLANRPASPCYKYADVCMICTCRHINTYIHHAYMSTSTGMVHLLHYFVVCVIKRTMLSSSHVPCSVHVAAAG